jgi:hypothetical protein
MSNINILELKQQSSSAPGRISISSCHPEQCEGSASVFAFAIALAFLSVIPLQANLLCPLL